jgi:hypothetical protein
MNKVTRNSELTLPKVTTGPLPASAKVYSAPVGLPDVRVPFREITLTETSGEAPFRAYDPSGPYTDAAAEIDVTRGSSNAAASSNTQAARSAPRTTATSRRAISPATSPKNPTPTAAFPANPSRSSSMRAPAS